MGEVNSQIRSICPGAMNVTLSNWKPTGPVRARTVAQR